LEKTSPDIFPVEPFWSLALNTRWSYLCVSVQVYEAMVLHEFLQYMYTLSAVGRLWPLTQALMARVTDTNKKVTRRVRSLAGFKSLAGVGHSWD
jgi:hypothetical protein